MKAKSPPQLREALYIRCKVNSKKSLFHQNHLLGVGKGTGIQGVEVNTT
jgi:hypothetical protein